MSLTLTVVLFIALLLIILGSGIYIGPGLALLGIVGFEYFIPRMTGMIGTILYNSTASFTLAAIPLFLFMGEIITRTGISQSLYRGISKWLSPLPGGLIHSNIFSCSLFAAISGSSVATAATIGSVAYPEQKKRGYPFKLIVGSLAAGGTIGILIPPSITMIVYGSMTWVSVGKLFIAGIIPGIILTLMFMFYIVLYSLTHRNEMPKFKKISIKEYFVNFFSTWRDIWPVLLILITIFMGIYGGFMTPTEAAAISVGEALIISLLLRKLSLNVLKESANKALRSSSMIFVIIIGAQVLGNCLSMIKVPARLCILIAEAGVSSYTVLFYVIILYLVLGCLISALSVIILTLPITYPLVVGFAGFNPLWFGIILVLLNQVALITPPVGLNVYIIHGITGEKNIGEIFSGIFPFFILMCIFITLMTFFPDIVLFLPNNMVNR